MTTETIKVASRSESISNGKIDIDFDDPNVDPALKATGGTVIEITAEASARVLKKIDRHMLPLLCWIYMIQFADKSSLNYSSLMGIKTDDNLSGAQYSWVGSIFYAGYIFWE
jgi:ACS family allantoate permease-like MFS transporter